MKRQILSLSLVIPGVALAASDLFARDTDGSQPQPPTRQLTPAASAEPVPALQLRRLRVAQDGAGPAGPMLRRRVVRQVDDDVGGEGPPGSERRIERHVRVIAGPGGAADHTIGLSWMGQALDGKPVKGAPFSATAVTEMEQPLADGNRIRQKSTSTLARDTSGRTRREVALGAIGPLMATGNAHKLVHIHDPATETNTTLDPERKTAFRMKKGEGLMRQAIRLPGPPAAPGTPPAPGAGAARIDEDIMFHAPVPGPLGLPGGPMAIQILDALPPDAPRPVKEDLGTQTIEGVRAQGTRTTITVPAGKIGNERPLVTVSERWFSPDLGIVVMTRHSDPRFGTTTYRLTDLDRREPPATQFEIPTDYKLEDGPVIIKKRLLHPEKPQN
jgi:hypothetical protein